METAILVLVLFTGAAAIFANRRFREGTDTALVLRGGCAMFFLALGVRIYLGASTDGFFTDLNTFKSWGETANRVGFRELYSQNIFIDYPPGYIYVLYILDNIRCLLGLELASPAYTLIIKLPSIFADMICGAGLYMLGKRKTGEKTGVFIAALYLFCPAVILNSAQWGQVDSFCTAVIAVSLFLMYRGRYVPAAALFGFAVACKPQMLVFAPVYIFFAIRQKRILSLISGVGVTVLTVLALATPFTKEFDYLWLLEKYNSTMEYYHYYSVNAYNMWALLGMNWVTLPGGIGTDILDLMGPALAVAVCGVYYFFAKREQGEERKELMFLCPVLLMSTMYFFSIKMHERYLYPVMLFLLISYAYIRDKRLIYSFAAISAAHYLNVYHVLHIFRTVQNAYEPNTALTSVFSLLQAAAYFYMLFVIGSITFAGTVRLPKPAPRRPMEDYAAPRFSFKALDCVLVLGLTLIYGIFAFWNLGSLSMANTSWTPGEGERVVLKSENETDSLVYLTGVSKQGNAARYRTGFAVGVETSTDGKAWTDCGRLDDNSSLSVYSWQEYELSSSGTWVRLTAMDDSVTLNEIALRKSGGDVYSRYTVESGAGGALADEQDTVPLYKNYMTSSYFDEIYHARTAWEHILGVEPYENTHPPLGKLIISLGIRMFGMNPFGWRFMGALFGTLMLPVFYHILRQLIGKRLLCCGGTLLFAFDFMHYTQTRIATIDTYAVFFILLMYDAMLAFIKKDVERESVKKLLPPLILSGIFMGLGIASKWTVAYGALGLAALFFGKLVFMLLRYRRSRDMLKPLLKKSGILCLWCCLIFVLVPFAIYFAAFLPMTALPHNSENLFAAFINYQKSMLSYHSTLVAEHYFASPWYEWPLVIRPIWYFASDSCNAAGDYSTIADLGNPLIWWCGLPGIIYSGILWYKKRSRAAALVLAGYISVYLPWTLVPRLTFIYHYFTAVPFLIIGLMLMWDKLLGGERMKRSVRLTSAVSISLGDTLFTAFAGVCLGLFAVFYPVLSGAPADPAYTDALRLFPTWYF